MTTEDTTKDSEKTDNRLERVDRLELENAFLQWNNLQQHAATIRTQFEVLRRDAALVDKKSEEAKTNLETVRQNISSKYGVDLTKFTVDQEGKFVPLRPDKLPFPVGD